MAETAPHTMRVKELYTYPIKSLRGISLPSVSALYTGFPHDRRFMIYNVDQQKNMHVAEFPEMCLFTTAFADDPETKSPQRVIVRYTKDHTFDKPDRKVGVEPLEVPLTPRTEGLKQLEVNMHLSPCIGYDMGEQYNKWFSDRFGYAVKLLYIGNNRRKVLGNVPPSVAAKQRAGLAETDGNAQQRAGSSWLSNITSTATSLVGSVVGRGSAEDKENDNEYEGVDEGLSFADVAPYLVVSTKSWENVQRRLPDGETVEISKFRPNIIVEGAQEDFEEDYWAKLQIGDEAKFILTQNCARCTSLNVDYTTGKVGEGEAGKILKKLQSDRRVDPGAKWSPVFGRYGFLAKLPSGKSAAEIKVGDEVKVSERNKDRTRFEWPDLSTK
ncbi:hypothetical protein A1O1_08301 [Capronia coronata CBS 617.96]|uniref:MOSC domain-containing protein n=1 Tax=Capronia coronata CBS 617.96 TaxID=1182541 RepID=W9YCU8_9EURO|nr:uncharacterized protein A1O1_08301 [Capronia coronata CBS 617.96]EXJ80159.1 hypothetical protein A1O1_08301 [Capronia coronata CBS 617.96]